MIYIHRELTLEVGDQTEEEITLWMVSYENLSEITRKQAHAFIKALTHWCLSQGWQLETGDEDELLPEPDDAHPPFRGRK